MKRIISLLLCVFMTAVLLLSLTGCQKKDSDEIPSNLLGIIFQQSSIPTGNHKEIAVRIDNKSYFFTGEGTPIEKALKKFFKHYEPEPFKETASFNTDAAAFSVIFTIDGDMYYIMANNNNQLRTNPVDTKNGYYCNGIFQEFLNTIQPYLDKADKQYRIFKSGDNQYQTTIYNKKGKEIYNNTTPDEPHIAFDGDLVLFSVQTGTDVLDCWSRVISRKTGQTSPARFGQSDLVNGQFLCITAQTVKLYSPFGEEPIGTLANFAQDMYISESSIRSARFSSNGKSVIVRYLSASDAENEITVKLTSKILASF